jgi:nucleoside-diphosphate-sugar epimerase
MADADLHVVFGAGQIGAPLARILASQGRRVRVVRRSEGAADPAIPVMRGDAGDPAFAAESARGAAVLYHCMNPAYETRVWERELPRIMQSLIAAARQSGARLVVLDNLYMLGRTGGAPMNEDTPIRPVSPKGAIRARVAQMLFDAHRRGEVRAVSGRGSDFYGPGGHQTLFGERFWRAVFAGKAAVVPMNPDLPHSWHYTLDVAQGLAVLGAADEEALGRAWMLPVAPPVSARALIAALGQALRRGIRVSRLPRPALVVLGLFMPILRELTEMSYQWDTPFVVDDHRFRKRFGMAPTPLEQGARATAEWAKVAFGSDR